MLSSAHHFTPSTCHNLIKTIANVPGDSHCAMMFFETVENIMIRSHEIICRATGTTTGPVYSKELLKFFSVCLRALLRMTIKVPLLFYQATWPFLLGDPEGASRRVKELSEV